MDRARGHYSGGGSRGAYGAGVLDGWTATGMRPDFEVVTGISTGAMLATFTFLGPEYDDRLRAYTQVTNDDIYIARGKLAALTHDALNDTAPLRGRLARELSPEILDAVARAHVEEGRRLFVGTTNLDAGTFPMWDLGAIAARDLPDKLERCAVTSPPARLSAGAPVFAGASLRRGPSRRGCRL